MKKFSRHRTLAEVRALCKAQGVPLDTTLHDSKGYDHVVVGRIAPFEPDECHVLYNTFNGRFYGVTDKGIRFDSGSVEHDEEPWMQALLDFFYTNDPRPEAAGG